MCVELLSFHLLWWSLQRSVAASLLFQMKLRISCSVSRLSAFETKAFLHHIGLIIGGHVINVHCIWFTGWFEIESSRCLCSWPPRVGVLCTVSSLLVSL